MGKAKGCLHEQAVAGTPELLWPLPVATTVDDVPSEVVTFFITVENSKMVFLLWWLLLWLCLVLVVLPRPTTMSLRLRPLPFGSAV